MKPERKSLLRLQRVFLSMALGSSDEVITHIREIKIVARNYIRIKTEDCDGLIE